jgi:Leucine-rich repeat (LRR) protein
MYVLVCISPTVIVVFSFFAVLSFDVAIVDAAPATSTLAASTCPAVDSQCYCSGSWVNYIYQVSVYCDRLGHRATLPSFAASSSTATYRALYVLGTSDSGSQASSSLVDSIQAYAFASLPISIVYLQSLSVSRIDPLAFGGPAPAANLNIVYLDGNLLTELPAGLFDGLTRLTYVSVLNNRLVTLSAQTSTGSPFSGAPNLLYVYASGNKIAGPDPIGSIGMPAGLRGIQLANNNIDTLPVSSFSGLPSLIELDLSGNAIASLNESLFVRQTALQRLTVAKNQLTTFPPRIFQSLSALVSLNLSRNSILNLPEELFASLTSVTSIDLSYNNILVLEGSTLFAACKLLSTVDLSGNGLFSVDFSMFAVGSTNGIYLKLAQNNITELVPGTINKQNGFTGMASAVSFSSKVSTLDLRSNFVGLGVLRGGTFAVGFQMLRSLYLSR